MHRTSNAFSVLQAIAVTAGLAILLWSIGLPSFRLAEAASVSSFSDTLSDAAPSASSNHTLTFTTPTGVANGETITLDFSAFSGTSSIAATDIDIAVGSDLTVGASCGAVDVSATWSGDTLVLTMCAAGGESIAAHGTTTIQIGTNADGGVNQLQNPGATGSYEIALTAGSVDSGETEVAIVDSVTVSASVDTLFNFSVAGVAAGVDVNGSDTTGGATSATTIPFGQLEAGTATTAAQQLAVTTNARNGFSVTVQVDQQLTSANGADIDSFIEGADTAVPAAWVAPDPTPGNESEYGHWGISSDDSTDMLLNFNGGTGFVGASTTPVEVFTHDGPSASVGQGTGTTTVIYKAEISNLQEAANDYTATVTYVATPIF